MLNLRPRVAVLFFIAVSVVMTAPSAMAIDYYADLSGGSWTSSTTWRLVSNSGPTAPAGTYPGSAAGDRAIMDFQGIPITVSAVVPNAVQLEEDCVSCSVTVTTGGTLPLAGTSSVSLGAILQMSGGTVDNADTLAIASGSSINWTTGTITGPGTTVINSGASVGAGGTSMILTGNQDLWILGTFTYGASAGGLQVNDGAGITIKSGGSFIIQNASGITTDGANNPFIDVQSGGLFHKTGGAFGTNIGPRLNNAGTVQTDISILVLSAGSHSGTFNMNGATTGFEFAGSPSFQNGTAITGDGNALLRNVNISGTVSATNITMDSFGSINGSGTFNLSGTFTWRASSISNITFNALNTSAVNITGEANTSLASAAHLNNQGTMTINPGATFSIVSDAHLTNDGTINIPGDLTISSDGAPLSRIDNLSGRSINKTSGLGSTFVNVELNNAGSVSGLQGILKLLQGGLHTGTWFTGTSAGIAFDGGVHQFTGGSFGGTGTYALATGTMDVDFNLLVGPAVSFQLIGGTLTGSGSFNLQGPFLWTGGQMDNSSGAGQTVLQGSSSQIASTTSSVKLSGRTLSQTGTFTYNPTAGNELSIDNGGQFLNTGTFNIVGDAVINSNGVSTPMFTNGTGGTINKSTGTGSATFFVYFANNQTLNLTSGNILLKGGGQELGTVAYGPSGTSRVIIEDCIFGVVTTPVFTGTGILTVTGATAIFNMLANVAVEKLELTGGAQLSGSGTLTINTSMLWENGTMVGPGTTTVANLAIIDASAPTGALVLKNRTLTNNGTINWNGNTQDFQIISGGTLNNVGTFTALGNGVIGSAGGTIVNSGTFEKTGGTSGTRIDSPVTNSGTLSSEVSGQSLIVAGGGSQTGGGVLFTSAGALLDFFSGTYSVPAGTSPFLGSGIFRVNGGTLAITGNTSVPSPAILIVQSGALDVATSVTFQIFNQFQWTGGTLQGNGTTRVFGGFIDNIAPTTLTNNHTLTIPAASFNYDADNVNFLSINGTANLNVENLGTMFLTANGIIGGTSTDGVTVSGSLTKTGSGVARLDVPLTTASGTFVSFGATGGTLQINGGGSSNVPTTIDTALSGIIEFTGGAFTMGTGNTVNGTGTINVNGGTLNVNTPAITFPKLDLTTGTLGGTGALTINSGNWEQATMTGSGSTTVAPSGSFSISLTGAPTLDRNLINFGSVTMSGSIGFSGSATVTNSSMWINGAPGATMGCSGCTGRFHNTTGGTYLLPISSSAHTVRFDNDGLIKFDVTTTLGLLGGGTHTGAFDTGSSPVAGYFWFGGTHIFGPTADVFGAGGATFEGLSTLQGTYNAAGSAFLAGSSTTFNTTTTATLGRVSIIGGTIDGTANLILGGTTQSTFTGGTIVGPGTVTNIAGSALYIDGGTLDGRTLDNNGTLQIAGNFFAGIGGGTVNNFSGLRADPTGSVFFGPAFNNQASAQFGSGNVAFNGGYTQTAGTTELVGGTFSSPFAINIDGGSVIGNGTITGNVINDGTFAPGASAGTITISGNYTQSSTGVLNAEIGGTAPGTQYDQLIVTGNAALDGTINVTTINSFTPSDANVFDLVTWGTRSGTFATVNLPTFPAGTLNPTYEPNAFRITADFVGDLSITKTGPTNAAVGSTVSFTIQVKNLGPSAADSVVVSDPTPANLAFLSNGGDCTTAFPCSLGTIGANVTKTITATYTVTGGSGTNVTNTASVSTTSTDNVSTNNSASATVFIDFADLAVTKTGPANAAFGSNVSFTIQVKNFGPSAAGNVVVSDPTPTNLTFVSTSGDCTTAFPCSLGTVGANVTKTIIATYTVSGGAGTSITNTASVSTTSNDNAGTNNAASATVFVDLADLAITKSGPTRADPGQDITFTITVANGGQSPAENVVVSDPTPAGLNFHSNSGACTTAFPCNLGTIASGETKVITSTYSVAASAQAGTITNTATVTTSTTDNTANNTASATVIIRCLNSAPENLTPTGTAAGSGTLSWTGTGESYVIYLGNASTGCTTQFATTTSKSIAYSNLAPGTYQWRVESLSANCRTFSSACVTFTVGSDCVVPEAPVASVVGQTTSAKTYEVIWNPVAGATRYEIEESTSPEFAGTTRIPVTGLSHAFKHDVTTATAFYYRVFAFTDCTPSPGPASTTIRVVIIPLPPKEQKNPSATVPAGSEEVIVQQVFIPGEAGQNLFFTASTDRPWLTVRPEQGVLTPNGITLDVLADPKNLSNGTFTASVIVTITTDSGKTGTNGTTTVTTPFSVNLVTPVTPVAAKPNTSQYALIIPSAGHLSGIDSQWQSDIRVTNAGFKSARYQLTFTPAGGTAQGVKQTTITVDAGATTALDDIVQNWFGLGTLGDGVNGMLEILPLDDAAAVAQSTVASSRTYNVTGNGTLGQYIPAVPFPSFIGRSTGAVQQILSLQQIAQNAAYRTNVGLAEAGGAPVQAVLSVFNSSGTKLTEIPVSLAAGEQRQMNQLLAQHNIELADGRIEVKVTGGDGKVTAYASVVDGGTQDPLLVSGHLLSGVGSTKFVLAGVANLDNALAHWRTDMRVFNYGTTSQPVTLTFFPFNNGAPKTAQVLVGARQVMTLDNILESQFDVENEGGVVHLSTPNAASLVVTGRTYNQTENGTFGQFIPAVTAEQAVGANGRTLHILQVEDSTRYRTNVGLAEVTGRPAIVELQVVLPDSKITPTVQVPLQANEFRQFNVIRELGVGNVYNARITVRVLSGDGRITAYGSVIDELTQDPTYVPAQ